MSVAGIYHLFSVEGKKALVTGGSAGIGRAIAEALIGGGAEVAIATRSDRVFDTAEEIGATPLQVDLSIREQTSTLVDRALVTLGDLDVLVNSAGVQRVRQGNENSIDRVIPQKLLVPRVKVYLRSEALLRKSPRPLARRRHSGHLHVLQLPKNRHVRLPRPLPKSRQPHTNPRHGSCPPSDQET